MGHTLTAITRGISHEGNMFREQNVEEKSQIREDIASACQRYRKEALVVENFLREYGLGVDDAELDAELNVVMDLARHANHLEDVQVKASLALDNLIPRYIENRRERLLKMVEKSKKTKGALPQPVAKAEPAVRKAFELFFSKENSSDGAHEALMCLATHHWKPKMIPETIPVVHRQTLARIRNKVLRALSDYDLLIFRHQQGPDDLGAFLMIAPLLYQDPDLRKSYR